jgi:hypothetical protein
MSDIVEIFDPRISKNRNVKNLKLVKHRMPDENGKVQNVTCVEYTVIGNHSEWDFYMFEDMFRGSNPDVKI